MAWIEAHTGSSQVLPTPIAGRKTSVPSELHRIEQVRKLSVTSGYEVVFVVFAEKREQLKKNLTLSSIYFHARQTL